MEEGKKSGSKAALRQFQEDLKEENEYCKEEYAYKKKRIDEEWNDFLLWAGKDQADFDIEEEVKKVQEWKEIRKNAVMGKDNKNAMQECMRKTADRSGELKQDNRAIER